MAGASVIATLMMVGTMARTAAEQHAADAATGVAGPLTTGSPSSTASPATTAAPQQPAPAPLATVPAPRATQAPPVSKSSAS